MARPTVALEIYGNDNIETINRSLLPYNSIPEETSAFKTYCEIVGRCLGLIPNEHFSSTLSEDGFKLIKKMINSETKSVESLSKIQDVFNMRLVLSVKKKNGLFPLQKEIFVTEPLEYTSSYSDGHIWFMAKSEAFITLEEIRKEEEVTE